MQEWTHITSHPIDPQMQTYHIRPHIPCKIPHTHKTSFLFYDQILCLSKKSYLSN